MGAAEATVAIAQWHAGHKQNAQAILGHARDRVASAAGSAVDIIGQARDKAPQEPGIWSVTGTFLASALHGIEHVGADTIDGLASMGNAIATNPGADAGAIGGALLAGVSVLGDAGGTVLDATGVGAIAGVPLNALSTAGVAAGGTLAMASVGDLASHAAGDDRIGQAQTGGDGGSLSQDPRLVPGTQEYDEYINELAKDPAHGGVVNAKTQREATVAVQAEADGDLPGPVVRTPLTQDGSDDGDFTDGIGQKWEVKSSPDVRPSYADRPGDPIARPQSYATFTRMINNELGQGQNVLLDPDGMTPDRLAHLQELVAETPDWQGRVTWGR